MAIHFISGKPGGGKTLYAVRLIVQELAFGTRSVFTNVPLKVGELNGYLQREYPKREVDLVGRLVLLSDDETGHFWTYRPGCRIAELKKEQWRDGQLPSYSEVKDSGVMYVIDEVHNFFGSRQWAETGRDVLFYLSQHRKLGDTVVCITQSVPNVDRQFRSVSQDFTYIRNFSKERYGLFKLPALFLRRTYGSPATDGGTTPAMETGTFRLDVSGLAACYSTAAGVGIHGALADQKEKTRGLSWAWGFAGVAAILAFAFWGVPRLVQKALAIPALGAPAIKAASTNAPAEVKPAGAAPVRVPGPAGVKVVEVGNTNGPEVLVTGLTQWGGLLLVCLSNGEVVRGDSGRITRFNETHVWVDGVRLRRSLGPSSVSAPMVGTVAPAVVPSFGFRPETVSEQIWWERRKHPVRVVSE